MAAHLIVEEGAAKGSKLTLSAEQEEQRWVIGQDPTSCTLSIADPSIDDQQLIIYYTDEGYLLENISDTVSLRIEGQEITEPYLLADGSEIFCGDSRLLFQLEMPSFNDTSDPLLAKEGNDNPNENSAEKEDKTDSEKREEEKTAEDELASPSDSATMSSSPDLDGKKAKSPAPVTDSVTERDREQTAETGQEKNAEEEISFNTPPTEEAIMQGMQDRTKEEMDSGNRQASAKNLADHLDELLPFDEALAQEAEESFADVHFDLEQEGRWLLKVISGPNAGAEFSVHDSHSYLIGTDPSSCDIVFHDLSVSRQHARLLVDDENQLHLEDLNSRNGTRIDGQPLSGKQAIASNTLVTMGTTTFLVVDREGERLTIISPPLHIKEEEANSRLEEGKEKKEEAAVEKSLEKSSEKPSEKSAVAEEKKEEKLISSIGALMLLAMITGIFVFIGIGATLLFKNDEVITQKVDLAVKIEKLLEDYPGVKFTYSKQNERILLLGHVLTQSERSQLRYNLQTLPGIRTIDDNIIIDELVWKEINAMLSKNPSWKGVSISAPKPGHFILSGYLTTSAEGERLFDWINSHFSYLDLLERRVIVEEDILNKVNNQLAAQGYRGITPYLSNGDLLLRGSVMPSQRKELDQLAHEFEAINGIKSAQVIVNDAQAPSAMVNLSDRYMVTGASFQGGSNINVVINGRILTRGDNIDGMTITRIEENSIFLEKDGFQYKIDFNRYR